MKIYEKKYLIEGLFKPALIVCGGSAYPREWDYAAFKKIADDNGSLLMCDMAHISGLVATQEAANPFELCDIVRPIPLPLNPAADIPNAQTEHTPVAHATHNPPALWTSRSRPPPTSPFEGPAPA